MTKLGFEIGTHIKIRECPFYTFVLTTILHFGPIPIFDHSNVAGSHESLRIVLDKPYEHGGLFGSNVIKRHPITKPEFVQKTNKVFSGLDVDVIKGHRVLCSGTGFDKSCNNFSKEKSVNYSNMLEKLAKHSKLSPQNVYKSFTNGSLTFIARTTPNADSLLREDKKITDKDIIPSMLNHTMTDSGRFSLFLLKRVAKQSSSLRQGKRI